MYIVTFYSFKGGVGRSMALVNIGIELAKEGHKVLLVDFDLEAPGLSTFEILKPPSTYKGIVEFVNEYKQTNEVPEISDFVYKVGTSSRSSNEYFTGDIWVMPAGMPSESYSEQLNSINWNELYEQYNGFLLFEDLKEQWRNTINPDYVLIDSRTGYTDVAGICTRQLPDAVCLLFFPNDQNLIGIEKVAGDIRSNPISDKTAIHFVMSNVPDMDDEDNILAERMSTFESKLNYSRSITIHHYANLALLNQSVFTLNRPNSRLAKEYRELSNEIRSQNASDREAALRFLKNAIAVFGDLSTYKERAKYLEHVTKIEEVHSNDPEIDYFLARFKHVIGDLDESLALLDRSIANGSRIGSAYINRSAILISTNQAELGYEHLVNAFFNQDLIFSYLDIKRGMRLSQRNEDETLIEKLINSPAVKTLKPSDQAALAYELMESLSGAVLAETLITHALNDTAFIDIDVKDNLNFYLILALIAQAKLATAIELLEKRVAEGNAGIPDLYNLAFTTYWANQQEKARSLFERVVKADSGTIKGNETANYLQCMSFAYWVLDRKEDSFKALAEAKKRSAQAENRIFSNWRFYKVLPGSFKDDLDQMKQLYQGKEVIPVFLQETLLI